MSLAERIKTAEAVLVKSKDSLNTALATLEANPEDETNLTMVEELTAQVAREEKTMTALQNAEKALMARAAPIGAGGAPASGGATPTGPPGGRKSPPPREVAPSVFAPAIITRRQEPRDVGDVLFKHATIMLLAHVQKKHPEQVLEELYRDQPYVKATWDYVKALHSGQIQKAAVAPALSTVAGWAAELVQNDVRGFIENLQYVSIAAALASQSVSVSFDGFQSITIPRRNRVANTATEPAWVGEGGVIPLTRFTLSSATLNRYKLAAITTMTREIADRSSPSIQAIVQDALREAYAVVLDAALLSSAAAVTNVRPAGLQVGAGTGAGTAGGGEDAVRADVLAMMSGLASNGLGVRPVLIINNLDALSVSMMTSALSEPIFATELSNGRLLGIPVIVSANMPQHLAMMVDSAYFASAFDPPQFEVSDVATVVEADAGAGAPTQAGTAGGHPGAIGTAGQVPLDSGIPVSGGAGAASTGYTARSMWQTYSLGIRMIAPTSWTILQTGTVQTRTTTTWS